MKRIKLTDAKQKERFITTMQIAGLAIRTLHQDRNAKAHLHSLRTWGDYNPMDMPACCMGRDHVQRYEEGWGEGIEFCEKCWQITIGRTDVILFPKRVVHYVEGREDYGVCGHSPSPVTSVFTDETTCPDCRMDEKWKARYAKPVSHYANFNPYYVIEYQGALPEGSLGDNRGRATKQIFRTREELERIPEKFFNLIRCPEAISKARIHLLENPPSKHNNWNYEPWNGREILVEVSIQ